MAIAVDATSGSQPSSSSTWTLSHTCASGASLYVCFNVNNASELVTGVTYNGVAMTQLAKKQDTSFNSWQYIYFLAAPASGANNVVVSLSSNAAGSLMNVSYTGVSATQPDSSNTNGATTSGSGTPFTLTTTVVASNCWLLAITKDSSGGSAAGSGTTRRTSLSSGGGDQIWDSNGTVGTGSKTLNMTNTFNPTQWYGIIVSIAPYVAPTLNETNLDRSPIRGVGRGIMRP